MKSNLIVILTGAILSWGSEFALAQLSPAPPAPRAPRPTLSPYLNLLDRTNSTSFNYYNRVRPRQAFEDYRVQQFQDLSALEKRVDRNRQDILRQSENSQLNPTGHRTRFMDLGGYFGTGPGVPQTGAGQFGIAPPPR
jgi:hypothetical protein